MASNTDLIIKLRAETAQLRKDLSNAKRQMGTFQKSMNSIGASIRSTMLTAFGGVAILQGIKSVISNLAEFELQMAQVAAISGATSAEIDKLTKDALELGRTTKFTSGEIASLQLELSKLGFTSSEILSATNAIQQLSLVTGEDLGESAKSMAGTLRSFNLDAEQSERVSNAMAESFSKSALTLEKFTVATANSGAIANAMGVTLEQNTARIGALVDANIDASKAGTDLRKIYIDLNEKGLSYDTALQLVAQSSDKVATATKLVGIRAAGALVILSQQRDKVKQLALELSDTNTEMGTMSDIINDTLSVSLDKLKSAIDGTIKKGGVFNDWLKDATDALTEFVQRQSETISETQFRNAIEDGVKEWKKYTQNVDTATKFLEFHKGKLNKLKEAVTAYEIKLRSQGKELNENKKEYRDMVAPMLKLEAMMSEATKIVERYNEQLEIENELLKKQQEEAARAARQLLILNTVNNKSRLGMVQGLSLIKDSDFKKEFDSGIEFFDDPDEEAERALEAADKVAQVWRDSVSEIKAQIKELNGIIEGTVENMIAGITATLASGGGLEAAFGSMLNILGDGLIQLGKALIGFGTIIEAIQTSLKSGLLANPVAAVAAGVAAVAAGAALKNAASSILSNTASGGTGGGGGTGGVGRFSQESTGKTIEVVGKISGRDIALVLANENQNKSRNGG